MNSLLTPYNGKRVFVTGDTGFKGSWLCLWLDLLGANVVGYALPAKNAHDHFNAIRLNKRIRHIDGDIRDLSKLRGAIRSFGPEFVFHLAAQPLVREGYREPQATFHTNVLGSVNLLESVRLTPTVRSVIYVTTDKCYLDQGWVWGYRENDQLGGNDPYSGSKAAAELAFAAYDAAFFRKRDSLGASSVERAMSSVEVTGRKIASSRDCIRALQQEKTIILRNPKAIRPWQHVLEPIGAYLDLAMKLYQKPKKFSGSWNFGPSANDLGTVQDVADSVIKHLGERKVETCPSSRPTL